MLFRFLSFLFLVVGCAGATFAIRDVTVVDPTGGPSQPHSTVVVHGEKIAAFGPTASTPIPKDARVVEGRGKFLIPGLWDMHVHLWYPQNQLPAYLAQGVTGVRDMGSDFTRVAAWRKAILDGKALGPHVLTSGPAVMGKPSDDPKLPSIVASTPEEARRAVDRLEDMGVDFIKVLSNVPQDAYIALAERARHEEIDFAGHVPNEITAWDALEARQNSIEHMFGMTKAMADDPGRALETFNEDKLKAFCERSVLFKTYQVPSLTLWSRMIGIDVNDARLKAVPMSIRSTWEKPEDPGDNAEILRKQLVLLRRMLVLMQRWGVGILAGTDTGDPYTIPGVTLQDELAMMVQSGLTPSEALRSATIAPAKYLGWDETVGQIRKNFLADMVLLDSDPLVDIRNVGKVAGVSIRGRWIGRTALKALAASSN